MKKILLLSILLCSWVFVRAQETIGAPYNPDSNADSLINLPDMLSILPLFGQPFLPSEDDLDSENEIQSLYLTEDTLYLIPNGGFILLSDLLPAFSYDSLANEILADSSFSDNLSQPQRMCSYAYPESEFGDIVLQDISQEEFIVPEGKNLFVVNAKLDGGDHLKINDVIVATGQLGQAYFLSLPIVAGSGDVLSNQGNVEASIYGFLTDAIIDPVTIDLSNESYEVPDGKKLVILNTKLSTGRVLTINEIPVVSGQLGQAYFLQSPLVVEAGFLIDESSSTASVINGYLVDHDYFDSCGLSASRSNTQGIIFTIEGF